MQRKMEAKDMSIILRASFQNMTKLMQNAMEMECFQNIPHRRSRLTWAMR